MFANMAITIFLCSPTTYPYYFWIYLYYFILYSFWLVWCCSYELIYQSGFVFDVLFPNAETVVTDLALAMMGFLVCLLLSWNKDNIVFYFLYVAAVIFY